MIRKKFILILTVLFLSTTVWGQVNVSALKGISNMPLNPNGSRTSSTSSNPNNPANPNASADSSDTDRPKGIEDHEEIPDSILQAAVFTFHRLPLEVKIMSFKHPVMVPTGGQFNDVLDAFNGNYYLTVTEMGHPHLAVAPTLDCPLGLTFKKNLYPGFYKTPDNITFYQVQKPYSLLGYHSSLNKDYQIHVTHTQNINNHWNVAFDYHLIDPKGSFANSSASDHLFDFNTNYYSRDNRYQLFAGFIWQRMVLGENNGLSNPEIFIDKHISNLSGIPVNETNRMSYEGDVTLFLRQSFNTMRQVEWYRPIHQQFTDTTITYDTILIPRYDSIKADTIFIDSIRANTTCSLRDSIVGYDTIQPRTPHCYNTGVFALDMQWDKQKYRYTDSSLYNQISARLYWTNDAYLDYRYHNPLKIYGGIRPQLSWLAISPTLYTDSLIRRFALYPFARIELSPWPASELNAYAEAAPDMSEYNLDATLLFPFRDSIGNSRHNLSFHAVVQARNPELIYYAQCSHELSPVTSDFHSIGVRKIEADYTHFGLFDIHLSAQHIDHSIWFQEVELADVTTNYMPHQTDSNAFLFQARGNIYLKLCNWLHLDMQQILQYSTDQNQIRVPLFASKNSLYSDFFLFHNALHAQIGTDIRYHTAFKADAYSPELGIFYQQDEMSVGNYIWADFFINLQIKRATIYAKAGHINSFIESHSYYLLPNYPSKQFGLYFGLTWRFFD